MKQLFWLLLAPTIFKLGLCCECEYVDLIDDSDFCFKFFLEKLNFKEAKQACEDEGGHLIEIDNDDQNKKIVEYFSTLGDETELLIGLHHVGK